MPKKYDVVAKNGEYTDKSGAVKSRWLNVGSIMENDKGLYMIMNRTFNPAGLPNPENKEGCFLSLFPAKESQNRQAEYNQAQPAQPAQNFAPEELEDTPPF